EGPKRRAGSQGPMPAAPEARHPTQPWCLPTGMDLFSPVQSRYAWASRWSRMSAMLSDAVDGFQLAYDRAGEGPPVVLLHGWPGDRSDNRRLAPLLVERGFEVVAPDLRGFGRSDRSAGDPAQYGVDGQARSVVVLGRVRG